MEIKENWALGHYNGMGIRRKRLLFEVSPPLISVYETKVKWLSKYCILKHQGTTKFTCYSVRRVDTFFLSWRIHPNCGKIKNEF